MASLDMQLQWFSIFDDLSNGNCNFNVLSQSLARICSYCQHVLILKKINKNPRALWVILRKNSTAPLPSLKSQKYLISVEPPSLTGPEMHRKHSLHFKTRQNNLVSFWDGITEQPDKLQYSRDHVVKPFRRDKRDSFFVKSLLTPEFIQEIVSTSFSCLMMQAKTAPVLPNDSKRHL